MVRRGDNDNIHSYKRVHRVVVVQGILTARAKISYIWSNEFYYTLFLFTAYIIYVMNVLKKEFS